jgi:hypothetical protein
MNPAAGEQGLLSRLGISAREFIPGAGAALGSKNVEGEHGDDYNLSKRVWRLCVNPLLIYLQSSAE